MEGNITPGYDSSVTPGHEVRGCQVDTARFLASRSCASRHRQAATLGQLVEPVLKRAAIPCSRNRVDHREKWLDALREDGERWP